MTSKQSLSKLKHDKKYSEEVISAIEKDLEDLEWLKKKVNLAFIDTLPPGDKIKLLEILGVDAKEYFGTFDDYLSKQTGED